MTFKRIGERIIVKDNPEFGDHMRIRLLIRNGWNDSCDWNESSLSLEEVYDLHYALGRLIKVVGDK